MRSITLRNGRTLFFAEYGDPDGCPVLFCHGLPGSRKQISDKLSAIARELAFRIIAPDRPGYGLSPQSPQSSYADWAVDAVELLNRIGITSCNVLGFSIGAPYALACASDPAQRFNRVALVSAMGPNVFDAEVQSRLPAASRDVFAIARDNPDQLVTVLKTVAPDASALLAVYNGSMSAPDNQLLADSDIAANFLRDCEETLRQGHDAAAADLIRYLKPWDVNIHSIHARVDIWHGSEDINAPPAVANHLASTLPRAQLRWLAGEGHLCLLTRWRDILTGFG